tara:strand:- start:477 stop:1625 length:1149 start_codon:yes stop_codon:yes gene_type:complete
MGRGRQRAKERAAAAQRRATAAAQRVPRTPKFPPEYKEEELKFAQEAEKHQESRQPPVNKQQKPKSEDLPEVKTAEVNNNNPFTNLRYPNQKLEIDSDYLQIDVLKFESSGLGSLQEDKTFKLNTITETINSKKTILGTIFLPIPNQIQDQNGVNWGSDSLNGLAAAGVDAASAVMQSGGVGDAMNTAGNQLNNFTAKILSSGNGGRNAMNAQLSAAIVNALGGNTTGSGLLARASGQILNPNMELLFNGVTLRSFNFTFDLAPRDQPESTTIKKIIRVFKKYMAAKTTSANSGNGLFIASPDVFQLTYKKGNTDHPFLHTFKPMALLNASVNYTGSGVYATYRDGTPVHMQLSLSFQELNPIYNEDYGDIENNAELGGVGF